MGFRDIKYMDWQNVAAIGSHSVVTGGLNPLTFKNYYTSFSSNKFSPIGKVTVNSCRLNDMEWDSSGTLYVVGTALSARTGSNDQELQYWMTVRSINNGESFELVDFWRNDFSATFVAAEVGANCITIDADDKVYVGGTCAVSAISPFNHCCPFIRRSSDHGENWETVFSTGSGEHLKSIDAEYNGSVETVFAYKQWYCYQGQGHLLKTNEIWAGGFHSASREASLPTYLRTGKIWYSSTGNSGTFILKTTLSATVPTYIKTFEAPPIYGDVVSSTGGSGWLYAGGSGWGESSSRAIIKCYTADSDQWLHGYMGFMSSSTVPSDHYPYAGEVSRIVSNSKNCRIYYTDVDGNNNTAQVYKSKNTPISSASWIPLTASGWEIVNFWPNDPACFFDDISYPGTRRDYYPKLIDVDQKTGDIYQSANNFPTYDRVSGSQFCIRLTTEEDSVRTEWEMWDRSPMGIFDTVITALKVNQYGPRNREGFPEIWQIGKIDTGYGDFTKVGYIRKGQRDKNSNNIGPRMLTPSLSYVKSEYSGSTYRGHVLNNISEFPHCGGVFQMKNLILGTTDRGTIGKTDDSIIQVSYYGSVVKVLWPPQENLATSVKGFGDFSSGERSGKLSTVFQPGDFFDVASEKYDHVTLYCYLTKEEVGTLDNIEIKIERRPLNSKGFATEQAIEYSTSGSFAVATLRDIIYKKEVDYSDLLIKTVAYPIDIPLTNTREIRISARQSNGQILDVNKNFIVWGRFIASKEEV